MVLAEMPSAGAEETGPFVNVHVTVNGAPRSATVETRTLLVHFLRENLSLTGTHIGCDTTNCGACTILLDGKAVKSCTVLAVPADGREVRTVEGPETHCKLHPIQESLIAVQGRQCGLLKPGTMLCSVALLPKKPH